MLSELAPELSKHLVWLGEEPPELPVVNANPDRANLSPFSVKQDCKIASGLTPISDFP
jgi:hypothetical protein